MSTFFFEILSEEVPARLQPLGRRVCRELWEKKLGDKNIPYGEIIIDSTPRRLWGLITGLPHTVSETCDVIKGPRIDGPPESLQGFLKTNGIENIESCFKLETPKGMFWSYKKIIPAHNVCDVMGMLLSEIIEAFPWPKSMRWDESSFRWVRPLRGMIALFDGKVVSCSVGSGLSRVNSGQFTRGHRYYGSLLKEIATSEDYETQLGSEGILVNSGKRKEVIRAALWGEAQANGFILEEDDGLLEEVTGLVEAPLVIMGSIEQEFMHLPSRLLKTVMKVHQRYFALVDQKTNQFARAFLVVADRPVADNLEPIRHGNETVLRARLRDAQFFYDQDRLFPLDRFVEGLKERHFFGELGTLYDKAIRLRSYAKNGFLETLMGADYSSQWEAWGERAGYLAKADLSTQMVGEFPELQGYMGGVYGVCQDEPQEVTDALTCQYELPDPENAFGPVGTFLGVSDRLDTLVGFFSCGVIPTGSRDPYALRRAALGVITLLRHWKNPTSLRTLIMKVIETYKEQNASLPYLTQEMGEQLLAFLKERVRSDLRQRGVRIGIQDGILQKSWYENIPRIYEIAHTLEDFFASKSGLAVFSLYKRITSLLEGPSLEKTSGVDDVLLTQREEQDLWKHLQKVRHALTERDSLMKHMDSLVGLLGPFDAFFEKILVNDENKVLKENRHSLLREARTLFDECHLGRIEAID